MKKKRLFQILSNLEEIKVLEYAAEIKEEAEIIIIKNPEKSLAMIKMREPVKSSLFYIGEVIITEAIVLVNNNKGMAVTMGDNYEKTLSMAIIDGAINAGIFRHYNQLVRFEQEIKIEEEKENSLFMKTKVDFHTMNGG